MVNPLRMMWERLSGSLWLVPGVIAVLAMLLAVLMVEWSGALSAEARAHYPRLFGADASGSRDALATIAGAIITVAGVTFSITMLVLSQAAAHYSPRLLRNFMRDRMSQISLGIMIGVFLYCLVVIRTIRGGEGGGAEFVPSLAVILAFMLAMLAIGAFVFFIHHIASSLEVGNILERISRETMDVIDRDYPDTVIDPMDETDSDGVTRVEADRQSRAVVVAAPCSGFIQTVDIRRLERLATAWSVEIRLLRGPGDFVPEGAPLAEVLGPIDKSRVGRALARAVAIGTYRTVLQDPAFGIRQITDIALKALSPAVNDVTTGITCIDYLHAILARAATRRMGGRPAAGGGAGLIQGSAPTFESLVGTSIDEIRLAGAGMPRVLRRLVEFIDAICTEAPVSRRRFLVSKLAPILQAARENVAEVSAASIVEECGRVQQTWK